MLTHSFEDLAQAFRVLVEAQFSFRRLFTVDQAEAIGNLENAINAKLNAFHNLYDLMLQDLDNPVNWYETPELCVILAIRNARHHNKANRIRSLYNYHRHTAANPAEAEKYFYVNSAAPPEEEGAIYFDVPLSWADLDLFLSLPRKDSRLSPEARGLVREYLNADKFEQDAASAGIDKGKVFFNFVPLSLNAGIALYPYVHQHVRLVSGEAECFLKHFNTTAPALTKKHETQTIVFRFPE